MSVAACTSSRPLGRPTQRTSFAVEPVRPLMGMTAPTALRTFNESYTRRRMFFSPSSPSAAAVAASAVRRRLLAGGLACASHACCRLCACNSPISSSAMLWYVVHPFLHTLFTTCSTARLFVVLQSAPGGRLWTPRARR